MLRRRADVLSTVVVTLLAIGVIAVAAARAQGLGGAGTVRGTVKDPTGGAMQAVAVKISNPVSGFTRTVTTDAAGKYVFSNLPPNAYHLSNRRGGIPDARTRRRGPQRRAD